MSSSNSASIFNLINGVYTNLTDDYYKLQQKYNEIWYKLNDDDKEKCEDNLLKTFRKNEKELKIMINMWNIHEELYLNQHEEFYDEKFKEDTQRKKGRYSQLKFSKKADKRLNVSWVKQDIGNDLYVSNKTFKNDLLAHHKQGNVKNFRKNSRQQVRHQTSRI